MGAEKWVNEVCEYFANDYAKARSYINAYLNKWSWKISLDYRDDAIYWLECREEMAWLD